MFSASNSNSYSKEVSYMEDVANNQMRHARFKALALLAALLTACCLTGVFGWQSAYAASPNPDYSWYKGQTSPYAVSTPQQWAGFVELVNGTADKSAAGVSEDSFDGDVIKLPGGMLNFAGMSIKPAGGQNGKVFKGSIEGNNTMLMQFAIDTSDGVTNVGLIGAHAKGTIDYVRVGAGASISITQAADGDVVSNVGMLVGSHRAI